MTKQHDKAAYYYGHNMAMEHSGQDTMDFAVAVDLHLFMDPQYEIGYQAGVDELKKIALQNLVLEGGDD